MSDPRYPHGPPPRPPSYSDNPFDSPFGGNGSPFGGNGNPFSANAQAPRRQREPAMSTLQPPPLPPRDNGGSGIGTALLVAGYAAAQYGNYKTATDDSLSVKERKQAVMAMSALSGLVAAPVGACILAVLYFAFFPNADSSEALIISLCIIAWAIITYVAYKVDHKRMIYRWNALCEHDDGTTEIVKEGFATEAEARQYSKHYVDVLNHQLFHSGKRIGNKDRFVHLDGLVKPGTIGPAGLYNPEITWEEAEAEMLRIRRVIAEEAEAKDAAAKRSAEALTRIRNQSREDRVSQWIS